MNNTELKKIIEDNLKQNKITFMTIDGITVADMDKICKQNADSILYDLNRDDATILTLAEKSKNLRWVNDYAFAQLFKYIHKKLSQDDKDNEIERLQAKINNMINEMNTAKHTPVEHKRMGDDLVCNVNLM